MHDRSEQRDEPLRPARRPARREGAAAAALTALAAVLLALLGGTAAGAQPPVPPGLGMRLLEAPSDVAADPRAQVYVIDHLAPGAVIERRLEISNGEDEPMAVDLHAVAATIQGDAFVGAAGREQNDLASWTTIEPARAVLAPGERREVLLRLAVPADAPAGERYAIAFAEVGAAGADGVALAARVGIRMYVSVGPGGAPPVEFAIDKLTAARGRDGAPVVLAQVTNTGGRALDFSGTLALAEGPGGLSAGPFAVTDGTTVAPGDDAQLEVVLDEALPDGPWTATLDVRSGLVEQAATASITFPAPGAGPRTSPVTPVAPRTTWPAWALLAAVSAALAAVAVARRRPGTPEPAGA